MLVLSDMGLHSYDLLAATLRRGAEILNRVPAHVKPQVIATLSDGTQLVRLRPSAAASIVDTLSYDLVKVDLSASVPSNSDHPTWVKITTPSGRQARSRLR